MIYITNPIALPLAILAWSLDAWLWLASIRLLLGHIMSDNSTCHAIVRLTDPLPQYVRQVTSAWTRRNIAVWVSWVITFICMIILRHTLLQLIVSLNT